MQKAGFASRGCAFGRVSAHALPTCRRGSKCRAWASLPATQKPPASSHNHLKRRRAKAHFTPKFNIPRQFSAQSGLLQTPSYAFDFFGLNVYRSRPFARYGYPTLLCA
ncbi:exported hypothetical protein [Paraburkholderia piptadeniae]|uniref:Uncharacterized protein n=1 Tax=Paraburkholderia piptadeniae TaxID=1701573 RepID=A0A1N7S6B5_9BURK|nr:exported hypothetical protein [Paraburkholderia piptadeniae]